MLKANIILKEILLFIFGVLFILGLAGFIDYLKDQPINWGDRLFKCILTVVFIRLFMFIGRVLNKKYD
ncbi:hypothetical protein [Oceanobacillus sp. FSL K6-0127]|uniref:hypothetical protein n=1 Tax=Oceanobacillus sp. FSL K6-0127 TaxID=2921420 RepID=UPI0030EF6430